MNILLKSVVISGLAVLAVLNFAGCSNEELSSEQIAQMKPETYARTLSGLVRKASYVGVTLELQLDSKMSGGKQDWNGFAGDIGRVAPGILKNKPEIKRLFIKAYDDSLGLDWGHFIIKRQELPANWQGATYLQLFSLGSATAGTLQAQGTLCDFYRAYETARPRGGTNC